MFAHGKIRKSFNSTLVQLKVTFVADCFGNFISFNSTLVQLKGFVLGITDGMLI